MLPLPRGIFPFAEMVLNILETRGPLKSPVKSSEFSYLGKCTCAFNFHNTFQGFVDLESMMCVSGVGGGPQPIQKIQHPNPQTFALSYFKIMLGFSAIAITVFVYFSYTKGINVLQTSILMHPYFGP